jgi:hypothetical protein
MLKKNSFEPEYIWEYITVSHASPAQDLYWFWKKGEPLDCNIPPPELAGVAALPGQPAPGGQHRVRPCPPPKLAAL